MLFTSLPHWRRHGCIGFFLALSVASGCAWSASPTDEIRQALQSGQLDQASKLLQLEKQNAPRDLEILFLEGVVLAQQGQTDKAIDVFRKLVETNPEIVEVHNNLGVLYAAKGRLDEARKALEMGMHAHASYAVLHRNLGDVQSQLAKQTYAKALQVDSKSRSAIPQLSLLGSMALPTSSEAPRSAPPVVAASARPVQPASSAPVATPSAPTTSKPEKPALAPPQPAPPVQAAPVAPVPAAVAPTAKPAPENKLDRTDTADVQAVRNAVQTWAKAWGRKDMDNYLDAYASQFVPAERMSRSKWESERRLRILSKKSISVEVKQLNVSVDGKNATAQFQQIYASDNFTGNSHKTLDMVKQGNRWLIVRETVN
jgi:ketosteroid isomerase-like protein